MTHPNAEVAARMRAAHRTARTALNLQCAPHKHEAWGWRGRTLGQPVTSPDGPAWLRVAAAPHNLTNTTFFDGARDSRDSLPTTVPRPQLRTIHDWTDHAWRYRAELYDRIDHRTVAPTAILTTVPQLPESWWSALRGALTAVTTVTTRRYTTDQHYLDWAMPTFLGHPIDTHVPHWTTAHGDLHWANLCTPPLTILDWEGWGLAPLGYDAATLHTYSLLVPETTHRIHHEFASILTTHLGRFAELTVITELLETTTHGDNLPLQQALRNRATHLLQRPIPS